jgi:pimeloyl-ACP methyl ester carboxylesterase
LTALDRRRLLQGGLLASSIATVTPSLAETPAKSYVLVHGAWHGGWCWVHVADALRRMGHRVTTPTQTGCGERQHLLSKDITLDTFVIDLVNHIEAEELADVVLVGHSFGGISITGVADRIPDKLRHLVYVDSLILPSGKSLLDMFPPEIAAQRRKVIAEQGGVAVAPFAVTAFGIPQDHPMYGWVQRRLTPQPAGTYDSSLRLSNAVGNGKPCTYISCTTPPMASVEPSRQWAKQQSGWAFRELATGHDAMVTAPVELTGLLAEIG